jgi:hypothetical protein
MATRKHNVQNSRDNVDILNFAVAGFEIRERHDVGGIELRARNGKRTQRFVLSPVQAAELSRQLFSAAIAVAL